MAGGGCGNDFNDKLELINLCTKDILVAFTRTISSLGEVKRHGLTNIPAHGKIDELNKLQIKILDQLEAGSADFPQDTIDFLLSDEKFGPIAVAVLESKLKFLEAEQNFQGKNHISDYADLAEAYLNVKNYTLAEETAYRGRHENNSMEEAPSPTDVRLYSISAQALNKDDKADETGEYFAQKAYLMAKEIAMDERKYDDKDICEYGQKSLAIFKRIKTGEYNLSLEAKRAADRLSRANPSVNQPS